jgi:hypothetical protein
MGVPVNLDEVGYRSFGCASFGFTSTRILAIFSLILLIGARGKSDHADAQVDSHRLSALPPLHITTNFPRPRSQAQQRSSTDSYRSSALDKGKDRELPGGTGSQSVPVSAVANGHRGDERRQREKYGLGSKPLLDTTVAEDLCGIDEGALRFSPMRDPRDTMAC